MVVQIPFCNAIYTQVTVKADESYFLFSACVVFKVAYNVTDTSGRVDSQDFTSVSDISKQGTRLNLPWSDGNKLDVTVRAIDVLGKYLDESVTVYRDATPPLIEDLWLTRGDRLNVSVHRIEDFTEMT